MPGDTEDENYGDKFFNEKGFFPSQVDYLLIKKRRPWVAGFLTLLVIGLGQVYNGDFKKGLVYYLGSLGISLLTAFLMLTLPFPINFLSFFLVGLIYFLYVFFVSWKTSKIRGETYSLRPYNKLSMYIMFIFLSWYVINPFFSHFIKNNIVHAYRVVANSMFTTILDGDHILVNELIYKFSTPQRGDVIIFKYPKNESQYFIKRVIGLPGEVIHIREKKCHINGKLLEEDYVIHISSNHHGVSYPELNNFGPFKIPLDSFFVMGDNRDWSMDSRSFGPVRRGKILGKAFMIYWSGSIDQEILWDRIGKSIK